MEKMKWCSRRLSMSVEVADKVLRSQTSSLPAFLQLLDNKYKQIELYNKE